MKTMKTSLTVIAMSVAIVGSATTANSDSATRHSGGALLTDVRAATARYHSPAQAERDGYVQASPCETDRLPPSKPLR